MLLSLALLSFQLPAHELPRVLPLAEAALGAQPVSITAVANPRSPGGPHDFSSEGDYWWPDPKNPQGPYVRRDGETNPDNFVAHRRLLFAFARDVGALMAAYDLTHEERFAKGAVQQLRVWFVDPATRMNPNLQYAQSIQGVCTGRGVGVIDTVHLAEVALGVRALQGSAALDAASEAGIKTWFREYLHWLQTHPYGIDESKAENNHGTCWALQAAAFARLLGDETTLADCRRRFREILLPTQMAADGSFPKELARTKPYGYSIFNLDVMTGLAVVLSTPGDDLMAFRLADGRGLIRGVEFLAPFIADKGAWKRPPDVLYWKDWPVRQPALLFGALAAGRSDWLDLWKRLPSDPAVEEVRRNLPIRFPTLWLRGDAPLG
ncbi:MAG: alginate lyase family protein [Opitutaceae bacterium]